MKPARVEDNHIPGVFGAGAASILQLHTVQQNLVRMGIGDLGHHPGLQPRSDARPNLLLAPVPWHVYVFACHGAGLLLVLEELKEYFLRRGHSLEFVG